MIRSVLSRLRRIARRLWVRVALFTVLALATAALAPLSSVLPLDLGDRLDSEALSTLLSIVTNSMLTVTTFSLSIMVTAHLAADANATPRAHRLLLEDGRTQTVIATFTGSFVYALALTVMQNAGLFAEDEVAVIYLVTVAVIALIVVAILRWVAHLAGLGSVEATIRRVEERARTVLERRAAHPFLGGRAPVAVPEDADVLHAPDFGYVRSIDAAGLSETVAEWGGVVHLAVAPGDWVGAGDALGHVTVALDETRAAALAACIEIGDRRDYEQDAVFALRVLTEIGERALSPGINDPRTAIDVTGRLTRLIADLPPEREMERPEAPAVHAAALDRQALLLATLDPVARDGSGFVEVQLAVQRALTTLSRHRDAATAAAARHVSARALAHAAAGIALQEDRDRIARAAPADGPAPMVDLDADGPDRKAEMQSGDEAEA